MCSATVTVRKCLNHCLPKTKCVIVTEEKEDLTTVYWHQHCKPFNCRETTSCVLFVGLTLLESHSHHQYLFLEEVIYASDSGKHKVNVLTMSERASIACPVLSSNSNVCSPTSSAVLLSVSVLSIN